MRVKALKNCYTISPSYKWSTGEIKDIPEREALKLLKNKNFVLAEEETAKQEQIEEKTYESHRKKRRVGSRI